jgi:predicted amidohydrolase YtcJ
MAPSGAAWADAVVVRGDRIAFVGDEAGARAHAGADAEVVDLRGGTLLPGFVDAHDHLLGTGAMMKIGVELNGISEVRRYVEAIADYARANPDLPVVRGYGFLPTMFPGSSPRRELLDEVIPDRPVVINSYDAHDSWFNTAAMRAVGLDASTPDPEPGSQYFVRDPDGTPSGHAIESAAVRMMMEGLGMYNLDSAREAQRLTLDPAPSWGITTVFEAALMMGVNPAASEAVYQDVIERDQRGELPIRVVGTVFTRSVHDDPHDVVARLQDWNRRIRSENVSITTLKMFSDGTMLSGTALVLEPYADKPHSCGGMIFSPEQIEKQVELAHLAGIDVHVHSDADGSVRTVLDAIERVQRRYGRRGRRHTICHNTLVHPRDVPRFAELGVIANVSPMWGTDFDGVTIDTYKERLGERVVRTNVMPYGDLVRSGAVVTYGADIPGCRVEEVPPLMQIEAAVTRRRPGHPDERAYLPEQRVSIHDAVRAYTINGAYQVHMEHEIGSIEVGKRADLVALGADLFSVPDNEIHQVPVTMTTFGGRITHDAR